MNQTDEEIKKEFFEENIPDYKDGCVSMSNIADWWLSKLHTLQEEYKKQLIEKIEKLKYPDGSCGNADLELANNQAIREAINIIKQ